MRRVTIASIRFAPESMPAVRAAVTAARAATLLEEGCIQYAFAEDVTDPGLLRVSEIWASRAALDAHLATPHVAEWRASVGTIGVIDRDIRVFVVDGEETL